MALPDPVATFALEARRYVGWSSGESAEAMDAPTARARIAAIYAAALQLPHESGSGSELGENARDEVSQAEWRAVYNRAATLPLGPYSVVFDPLALPAEEPVVADLADDIADVHRDLARGLRAFDRGEAAEALWEWSFGFRTHWGRHAVHALGALHVHLEG